MRRPDLFVVGAVKCGTTALHAYLSDHPRVFMSRVKEPRYFADDHHRFVTVLDDYLALFEAASDDHLAVGESSPTYLASAVALPRIRKFSPAARIVVMVRNPIDLVHSFHAQQLLSLNECEPDFERAWRLQESRREGSNIPATCRSPALLQYATVARLGEQVERTIDLFGADRVHAVVFDDFVRDTRAAYEGVLRFLGVPSDGRTNFPRVNPNQVPRIRPLSRFARRPPAWLLDPYLGLKKRLGLPHLGLAKRLKSFSEKPARRAPIAVDLRREMIEEFRSDVARLGRVLGRSLDHWLAVDERHDR